MKRNNLCLSRQRLFLFWSRVRESNPPSRLGKPLYYRYTNPASVSCAVAIPPALQSKATFLYTREAMRVDRHIAQFIITKSFGESKCFLTLGIYRGRWIFALFTFLEMCGIMFGILRGRSTARRFVTGTNLLFRSAIMLGNGVRW